MRILLLALSILFATVAHAQDTAGRQQLLLNDKGNVIIGTTTATGETRIIHNGTIVLTTTSGGVDLGGVITLAGELKGTGTQFGWVTTNTANTACTTQCSGLGACVAGYDAAGAIFRDCTNATSDSCICTGT